MEHGWRAPTAVEPLQMCGLRRSPPVASGAFGAVGFGWRSWLTARAPSTGAGACRLPPGPWGMGLKALQHGQQLGAVVGQLWIEVLDVGRGGNGAAHRNTPPQRPGARAGWLLAAAVCVSEGKNSALTVIQRSRQAFTWRGAWIQFGSSQAPKIAAEKTIWPVRRPWEVAAPISCSRGFIG